MIMVSVVTVVVMLVMPAVAVPPVGASPFAAITWVVPIRAVTVFGVAVIAVDGRDVVIVRRTVGIAVVGRVAAPPVVAGIAIVVATDLVNRLAEPAGLGVGRQQAKPNSRCQSGR